MSFHCPDDYRVRKGARGSNPGDPFGAFFVPRRPGMAPLKVIATDGEGISPQFEHVSVSLPDRCPTWAEMCRIKELFWDEEDCVMQLHPPRSEYVNNHPFCLHLWRPVGAAIPMPPSITVGIKEVGVIA